MIKSASQSILIADKTLHTFAISLGGDQIPEWVMSVIEEAFRDVADFIKDESQVLYLRDIPFLTIDGKYTAGACYNRHEAMIVLLNWQHTRAELTASINHELHHMARWQNVGYGDTLGGAILSEGIATYYEGIKSDWISPWSQADATTSNAQKALEYWDEEDYDHDQWFYESNGVRWAGYGLGMLLARELYKDGFDLKNSILITSDQAKDIFSRTIEALK